MAQENTIQLYFCQWTRQAVLTATKAYCDGFSSRLLPEFDNIEEEAKEASNEYWQAAMSSPAHDGGFYYDPSEYAEAAQEAGSELYENLDFVKQQLIGLALAGLYHLWERSLKQFIARELRFHSQNTKSLEKLYRMNFEQLASELAEFGFDFPYTPHYKSLNELCLIANTVKHGDGQSCNDLSKVAPHLFDNVLFPFKKQPSYDDLRLSQGDFMRYAEAVEIFWTLFPERLSQQQPK